MRYSQPVPVVIFGGAAALLPIYATDILHAGPRGYGAITRRAIRSPATVKSHLRSAVPPGKLPVRRPVTT